MNGDTCMESKTATLVCDGTFKNNYNCNYKKIVPYKERFWYSICPMCGGKLITWKVD